VAGEGWDLVGHLVGRHGVPPVARRRLISDRKSS
jgi:hypothetical protein